MNSGLFYVDLYGAQTLDAVYKKQDVSLLAEGANFGKVVAEPCGKFNRTDGNQARVFIDLFKYILYGNAALLFRCESRFNTACGQV